MKRTMSRKINELVEEYRDSAFEQIVKIGKSLGNVSRLKLLDNLAQGKKSVEDLAKNVGLTTGTASKNLQLLKKAGLVKESRDKNFIFYKLTSKKIAQMISLLIDIGEESLPELRDLEDDLKIKNSKLPHLSVSDLKQEILTDNPYVIDLRPRSEYMAGHLPGSHNVPYSTFNIDQLNLPKDRTIVVYCRGRLCAYSDVLGEQVYQKGFNVQVFNHTVEEWNQKVTS